MATRRDIREAFYTELETSASATVPSSSIGQEYPNEGEELPAIVHRDNYRKVPMNRGAAPTDTTVDSNGVQEEIYSTLMQAQFSVLIVSDDEQEKETVYESVREYFEEFTHPVRDSTEIHDDCHRVEVQDSTSEDSEDRDPPARGDRLTINLGYERKYVRDVDPIDTVEHDLDVDNDDVVDITYTTT